LEYRLYLPPCYDELPDQHYPVLYLIHGQSFDDTQWERLGMFATADRLIANGEISPLIIVLPRDRLWLQPTESNFAQAIVDELIPTVDDQYRTIPERGYRAVGGLSRGASWAIHLALNYWPYFSALGGHSPPVFWADIPYIKVWLDAIPLDSMPRIYLDMGDNDRPEIVESATWFEQLLTERNILHEWHLFQGYHEEAYWAAHVEDYLRWYAASWQK